MWSQSGENMVLAVIELYNLQKEHTEASQKTRAILSKVDVLEGTAKLDECGGQTE